MPLLRTSVYVRGSSIIQPEPSTPRTMRPIERIAIVQSLLHRGTVSDKSAIPRCPVPGAWCPAQTAEQEFKPTMFELIESVAEKWLNHKGYRRSWELQLGALCQNFSQNFTNTHNARANILRKHQKTRQTKTLTHKENRAKAQSLKHKTLENCFTLFRLCLAFPLPPHSFTSSIWWKNISHLAE